MRAAFVGLALSVAPLLLAGCASPGMKGTPFYTGEEAAPKGPVENRVNAWPLLYYREPVLSVLWPLMEWTDDYVAVRPFFSVSGLGKKQHTVNVLWPIAQFDGETGDDRVFPFFWGDGYFTGFPLYWHSVHPGGAPELFDALFPLWSYARYRDGFDTFAPWPLIRVKQRPNEHIWHVFPLAGSYERDGSLYEFVLWPLGHRWVDRLRDATGDALLPVYYRETSPDGSTFASLPWCSAEHSDGSGWELALPWRYKEHTKNRSTLLTPLYCAGHSVTPQSDWRLVLPLYFAKQDERGAWFGTLLGGYHRDGEERRWLAAPVLSMGSFDPDGYDTWIAGGLVHAARDKDSSSQHVIPLFYHAEDPTSDLFVSLPWSAGQGTNGESWMLAPPFFYKDSVGDRRRLFTPLYAQGVSDGGRDRWDTVLPLYFRHRTPDETMLVTLLGGYRTAKDRQSWLIYPLLSGGRTTETGGELWVVPPLVHAAWEQHVYTHHVLPLYYWNEKSDTLVSPLAAHWHGDGGNKTVTAVPPLLSWEVSTPTNRDLWLLGGLARTQWGESPGPEHVVPIYYRNPQTGTLITPLYAGWRGDNERRYALIPPLLSWESCAPDRSDLWVVGPLAHFSWGPKRGAEHVLPLYYRNPATHAFASPLVAAWGDDDSRTWLSPLLLSVYFRDHAQNDLWAGLGIFHQHWGENTARAGHLLPLYVYEEDSYFYSLLCGWNKDPEHGFVYPVTPLAAVRTGDYAGGWLFPLFSYERNRNTDSRFGTFLWGIGWKDGETGGSCFIPLYFYKNRGALTPVEPDRPAADGVRGTDFFCLPICWYNHLSRPPAPGSSAGRREVKKYGVFPLWSYASTRDAARSLAEGSIVWLLYDYKREIKPAAPDSAARDYTRARVLWRLWHYERENGNVTMDAFPAITYDRRTDGFKRTAFLWRLFRYERDPDGARKLDLLFVPLLRSPGPRAPLAADDPVTLFGEP